MHHYFFFSLHGIAHGTLVPQPGVNPEPSAMEHGVLTTGPQENPLYYY